MPARGHRLVLQRPALVLGGAERLGLRRATSCSVSNDGTTYVLANGERPANKLKIPAGAAIVVGLATRRGSRASRATDVGVAGTRLASRADAARRAVG